MLTPISTASTAAGPSAGHQWQQHQHRGQVVDDVGQQRGHGGDAQQREQRRARAAASACIAIAEAVCITAGDHHAEAQHEGQERDVDAATMPRTVLRPRARLRTPSTTAPASAAHAGAMPKADVTANPASVSPSTTRTNTGTSAGGGGAAPVTGARVRGEKQAQQQVFDGDREHPWQRHQRGEVGEGAGPAALNASRLVRLDTGSSSDAVFDRCAVAYACGFGGLPQRAGGREHHRCQQHDGRVQAQHGRGAPPRRRTPCRAAGADRRRCAAPSPTPAAWNRPSSSQSFASTSTAARKPTTGSRSRTSATASSMGPRPSR